MGSFTVTLESCRRVGFCSRYPPERVEKLAAGRESMTALEFTYLGIPAEDILYQLCQQLPAHVVERAIELVRARRGWPLAVPINSEEAQLQLQDLRRAIEEH